MMLHQNYSYVGAVSPWAEVSTYKLVKDRNSPEKNILASKFSIIHVELNDY